MDVFAYCSRLKRNHVGQEGGWMHMQMHMWMHMQMHMWMHMQMQQLVVHVFAAGQGQTERSRGSQGDTERKYVSTYVVFAST